MSSMNRRQLLQSLAALGAAASATACARTQAAPAAAPATSFRFAHLTDMHVRRKRQGDKGYRACIAAVNALRPAVDLVLTGGDLAFDGLYTAKEEFADQIQLYKSITAELTVPAHPCLGNHDILGWSARRKVTVDDPDFGKKMMLDALGMEKSYYSFDHKDWHFVVLDSIHPVDSKDGPSYEPRLGAEQLDWLAHDLGRAHGRPTVVVTHIAAFCHIGQINGDQEAKAMNPGMVLRDTKDFRLILERHGVKAVLQGHSHMTEDFTYRGVHYLTSPAVSGCWWGGTWNGFQHGFTVFDCRADGTLHWERHTFPWVHQFEPDDEKEIQRQSDWEKFLDDQRRLAQAERQGT